MFFELSFSDFPQNSFGSSFSSTLPVEALLFCRSVSCVGDIFFLPLDMIPPDAICVRTFFFQTNFPDFFYNPFERS
ncbi:MAG TPA: hypothetical protein DF364_05645 [Ruminococcaceae bacterium]|nr:hypothetical protein [Oscillospiraceae bacterium]HCU33313.1 hypothetical protein [Oscillospiraceae bacterium]